MKKLMNKYIVTLFLGSILVLSSCLEDTGYLDIFNKQGAVGVASFGQSDHERVVRTVEVDVVPQPISVSINIARAPGDVTVTLAIDPTALDKYNAKQLELDPTFVAYSLLPDSTYSIPSLTVTVPASTLDGQFVFNVNSSKIDLAEQYMLPLVMTSSSAGTIVASNLNTALVAIAVKNVYDGIYEIVGGSITRNSAAGPDLVLGGNYNPGLEIPLATLSANQVSFAPLWKEGSGIGGIDNTYLTINTTTNGVTVLSKNNATLKNTPTLTNSYDPATKTFTLNFDWGGAPNTRVLTDMQLKYDRPRP